MLVEALKLFGVHEAPGAADNPIILAWRDEIAAISPDKARGVKDYVHDETAWCGLFMALVASRAGKSFPDAPLWALNWWSFGEPISDAAMLGDVLVFERHDNEGKLIGGHVGIYVGADDGAFHVLGGNEGDAVSIIRIAKSRLRTMRRPFYRQLPAEVTPIFLASNGALSTNEA